MIRALHWAGLACAAAALVSLGLNAWEFGGDQLAAIRYPFQLDYGEGIVWQQAVLIPGSRMYSPSQALPFIVFHYPPLFHLVVRAVASVMPDMLAAGRLVSGVAAFALAPLVGALVWAGARTSSQPRWIGVAVAVAAGLSVLCLHAVREWGLFMRVDMLAVALGLAGMLVAARSDGSVGGTTLALLLCLASVYTKQTQLPAGLAVVLVALLRRPRAGLVGGAVALAVGLGVLGWLQLATDGGFLRNIVGYNVNRFDLREGYRVLRAEQASARLVVLMPLAWAIVAFPLLRRAPRVSRLTRLRSADRATATRALLLAHFALATLLLAAAFKSGSDTNYMLDWMCGGAALVGIAFGDLARSGRWFPVAIGLFVLATVGPPGRSLPDRFPPALLSAQEALVARVSAADKPVASADMVLLMRAGQPLVYEPAIVTELAALGRWDETPLVEMTRAGGFAFVVTADDIEGGSAHRSPAIDAAMRTAYPQAVRVARRLWIHLPR